MAGTHDPLPLYGIFRYLYLVHRREGGGQSVGAAPEPTDRCSRAWRCGRIAVAVIIYRPA